MMNPRHKTVALACALFIVSMFGLSYASVPFYNWFCRTTGFGGTPLIATKASSSVSERMITVRFDSNAASDLDWRFTPRQNEMRVKLGQVANIIYTAENLSNKEQPGTATYNVSPPQAAAYFNKLACFCFTTQVLKPHEKRELGVSFFIDPDLVTDKSVNALDTITLSYTFYPQTPQKVAAQARTR